MKAAIFAYSRKGCDTARRIEAFFAGDVSRKFTMARFEQGGFEAIPRPSQNFYGEQFAWADALIFVGSCGIAVREIAPHLADKRSDPAVLAVDELSQYVIPLLSGHIGGANELALRLAKALGSLPVITTATDINKRFSVDAWAARRGYVIGNISAAKAVSAAILERDVPLLSDFALASPLPAGVIAGEWGEVGVYVGYRKKTPFDRTLQIVPRALHVGVGCRRGTGAEAILAAVGSALDENGLDERAVKIVASIDLKKDEPGLLSACESSKWPLAFYTARELSQVRGEFTASDFVASVTGVDNVCERAALLNASELIVRKTILNGVTVAVAAENVEVSFE